MSDGGAAPLPGEQALPAYTEPPARRSGAMVAVGAAVAALLVAGVFAVVSVTAGEGAGSPEAAVSRLFDAVEQEDVLGVLESLAPGERDALRPGIVDIAEELQRLGVLSDDLDLRSLSGLDVEVDGLAMESEILADGIAAVSITGGTITTSAEPEELPLGPVVRGFLEDAEAEPHRDTEELAGEARIVTTRDDGGWHVSLFYSVAEAAREGAGMPLPDFGAGLEPVGSESPEAVLADLASAAAGLDLRAALTLVDPVEGRALYDYAPLFLDEADRAIADLRAEGPLEVTIDDLETSVVDRSGGAALVVVEGYDVRMTVPDDGAGDGQIRATWDGKCTRVEGFYGDEAQEMCLDELTETPLDFDEMSVGAVVVERDGRWFLSPTRSLLELTVQLLGVFDREDLEDPEALFESIVGMPFGFGATGPSGFTVEEDAVFQPTGPPIDDEDLVGEGPQDFEAYQRCFSPMEELPPDASQAEFEAAQRQVDECLESLDGG